MPRQKTAPGSTIAALIEQLERITHSDAFTQGLNPAQWAALRYFAHANRFSRTVGAFAQYHGTTRGTATQTVKALIAKHYLERCFVATDRRSFRLELTAKGRDCLVNDPIQELITAANSLPFEQHLAIVTGLQTILGQLHSARGHPLFGVCTSCAHLRYEQCEPNLTRYECMFLQKVLIEEDLSGICVNYKQALTVQNRVN